MAHRLVVVYAKSGMGKSSLLNAGLKAALWEQGVLFLPVRLNDPNLDLFEAFYNAVDQAATARAVEHKPGLVATLWHYFKTTEFWRGDLLLTPLLILDQFEELFTLQSPERRGPFIQQLAELVRGVRPSMTVDEASRPSDGPPDVKVILSLREDYLGQLEEVSTALPEILDVRFRLGPLFEPEARQAVEEPARVEDPRLEARPFTYTLEALNGIWTFLSRRLPGQVVESKPYVEPFQLQLVCQLAEEIALRLQRSRRDRPGAHTAHGEAREAGPLRKSVTVTWEALGKAAGLRTTLASFCERQLAALPVRRSRRPARSLCEEGLISPTGRRLSLEEGEIQRRFRVAPNVLAKLVELRLLRADTRVGSIYYELSHDTLVEPILEWRKRREGRHRIITALLVLVALASIYGLPRLYQDYLRPRLVALYQRHAARGVASDLGWVHISAPTGGYFMMGCAGDQDSFCNDDEKPRHPAALTRGFDMMSHEVTVGQFRQGADATSTMIGRVLLARTLAMEAQPSGSTDSHPVVSISWDDAVAFCAFVSGRLPTEAEWEYAARRDNPDGIYPWGDQYSPDRANSGRSRRGTMPVGSFPPNSGLYDMAGNVWEWTSSKYRNYPYRSDDGREDPASRESRVSRGGSWYDYQQDLRVSYRDDNPPGVRDAVLGFRCARDVSP